MNHFILCKIGIHDWDQYMGGVFELTPVKICKKCMIKYEKSGYWFPHKYHPGSTYITKWRMSDNYTIVEIREMKLRKILNEKM